jgi:hypothetical protein
MCLTTVTSKLKDDVRTGYKVLERFHRLSDIETAKKIGAITYTFPYFPGQMISKGEWMKAEGPSSLFASDAREYLSGFHIFVSRKDAERFMKEKIQSWTDDVEVFKVEYKIEFARGTQEYPGVTSILLEDSSWSAEVVVACFMRVVEELS